MGTLLVLVAAFGCLASSAIADSEPVEFGSPQYLEMQKDLLVVLKYVHQPYWNSDLYSFAHHYNISEDIDSYTNGEQVKRFINLVDNGKMLKRDTFVSLDIPEHLKQVKIVYDVLYSAKNYETLAKVVSWARFNLNEKMFMYVMGLIVAHRKDVSEVILMPTYEMCPYQFINSETIKEAQRIKMQGFIGIETVKGMKRVVVPMNFTGWYKHMNPDQKLTYLTEDPSYNNYYYNYHLDYPHWLEGKPYGLDKDRRGELYLHIHHSLMARYYMERLSNGLGEITDFDWREPIMSGYHPSLMFYNGQQHLGRPNNFNLYHQRNRDFVHEAEDRERRIRDVVDKGFIIYEDKSYSISKPEDVNTLGNLLQGNPDGAELHHNYYNHALPWHLRNYPTALRDPLFYQFYKRLMKIYHKFMSRLAPYTVDEIGFAGVEITSVKVNKVETFFEEFDIDITNAIDVEQKQIHAVKPLEEINEINFKPDHFYFKARTLRLNHKPAKFLINVKSDKAQTAIVRIFLGPKFDEYGSEIDFMENRKNFIILDLFTKVLKEGVNVIDRTFRESYASNDDPLTFYQLYKRVMTAKKGEKEWDVDYFQGRCRFPKHLYFPKGTVSGMTYQYYIIINQYLPPAVPQFSTFDPLKSCGVGSGSRYIEDRAMLFPIDREVDPTHFYTPNMHFEDVEIQFNPDIHK